MVLVNPAALPCADKLGNGDLQVDCGRTCEGCCSEGMEEIGGCCSFCCEHNKEGLDVVIFSTCITTLLLASSIDEVCDELLFLIAEEEVSEYVLLLQGKALIPVKWVTGINPFDLLYK